MPNMKTLTIGDVTYEITDEPARNTMVKSINGVSPDENGAVTLSADDVGAIPNTTEIPTDARINSLIDAKLAAIPDASEVAY